MVSYKFKRTESNNLFPEGFNRAILTKVAEIDNQTSGKSWIQLTFKNGVKVHNENLYLTAAAEDRLRKFIVRLGLVAENETEKEVNIDDAIGTEYVIEIKHETYEGQERSKLSYVGLWPLDHDDKKVVAWLRTEAGQVSAAGTAESAEPPAESDDLSDI